MYALEKESITGWHKIATFWAPKGVKTECPFCGELVVFTLGNTKVDEIRITLCSTAECPNCAKKPHFFIVEPGSSDYQDKQTCECIAIYPKPKYSKRKSISDEKYIPTKIHRVYKEAIDGYNAEIWNGTGNLCRRTLEAIVVDIGNPSKKEKSLKAKIDQLKNSDVLIKPIEDLYTSVRMAGNVGSHYIENKEITYESAKIMMDLVDYLLMYVYVLPKQADNLKKQVKTIEPEAENLDST
ncbi:DUF4145 domain-containing protein [Planctomycetota bacterium]